jgi:uncharacterized protein (TIGR02118 family)
MVKLVVAYGKPEDAAAFDEYYANTHEPLVHKIPGLDRFEHGHVLGTPDGSEPPYWYIALLYFADMEALQAGLGSDDGQAAAGDVANFATGGASVMIAEA